MTKNPYPLQFWLQKSGIISMFAGYIGNGHRRCQPAIRAVTPQNRIHAVLLLISCKPAIIPGFLQRNCNGYGFFCHVSQNSDVKKRFKTLWLSKCTNSGLLLWLWKKIRKSSYACLSPVMFCHGWQNKASRAMDGSLNAVHVNIFSSESGIARFSYFRTPEQGSPGFVQSDSQKIETHLLTPESSSTSELSVPHWCMALKFLTFQNLHPPKQTVSF